MATLGRLVAPSLEGHGKREKKKLGINAIVSGPEVSWKLAVKGQRARDGGRGFPGIFDPSPRPTMKVKFPLERFRDDFSRLFRLEVIMRVPVLYESLELPPVRRLS